MRYLILPEPNYQVLMNVFGRYCLSGVDPSELQALAETFPFLQTARQIDPDVFKGADGVQVSPEGATLVVGEESPEVMQVPPEDRPPIRKPDPRTDWYGQTSM